MFEDDRLWIEHYRLHQNSRMPNGFERFPCYLYHLYQKLPEQWLNLVFVDAQEDPVLRPAFLKKEAGKNFMKVVLIVWSIQSLWKKITIKRRFIWKFWRKTALEGRLSVTSKWWNGFQSSLLQNSVFTDLAKLYFFPILSEIMVKTGVRNILDCNDFLKKKDWKEVIAISLNMLSIQCTWKIYHWLKVFKERWLWMVTSKCWNA